MTNAIILVDVQNDFIGGSLPVPSGEKVAYSIANHLAYNRPDTYVVATKDFHNPGNLNGGHFSETPDYIDTWPAHCVAGTEGAEFHRAIEAVSERIEAVFYKGWDHPAYSGFEGITTSPYFDGIGAGYSQTLHQWLQERGVTRVQVCGLTADYCVRQTALDAIDLGYNTFIPSQLTAAIHDGGVDKVVKEVMTKQYPNLKEEGWTIE